jgi:hypothetical protein
MGSLELFPWAGTVILLISAFHVARITSVNHMPSLKKNFFKV